MKIKNKVFSIIVIVFLLLFIISSLISLRIILKSFSQLENEKIDDGISLLNRTINSEIDNLDSVNGDWAPWDDTYYFVKKENDEYIDTNLNPSTLDNLRVNSMLFYDNDNKLAFDATDTAGTDNVNTAKNDIIDYIGRNDLFINEESAREPVSGIILVDKYPIIISSRPITDSSEESDIAGRLVMLRYMDDTEIGYIESLLGQEITLFDSVSEIDIADNLDMAGLLDKGKAITVLNEKEAASFLVVDDLTGQQPLIIEQNNIRSIYERGKTSALFSVITFIILLVLIALATLIAINKIVLKRILKLSSELERIGTDGNFSERVSMGGSDEISLLQNNINNTLSSLESELEKRKKSEKKLHEKSQALEKTNQELEQTLEDFYTVRIGMYEEMKKGEVDEKNKEIKKRLGELKIKTD